MLQQNCWPSFIREEDDWGVLEEQMYSGKICGIDNWRERLVEEWNNIHY